MTPCQDLRPEPGESESERAAGQNSSLSGAPRHAKRRTVQGIIRLRAALAEHLAAAGTIEGSDSDYVRFATWNIRLFGANSHGGRLPESYYCIAEIISHFDLVGLQEVRSDLTAFRRLLTLLGADWDFLATDVTEGSAGNDERLVYLYRKTKVRFTGIAGELVLADKDRIPDPHETRLRLCGGLCVLPAGELVLPAGELVLADKDRIPDPHETRLRLCGGLCVLPAGEQLRFDGDADIYRGGTRQGPYTRLREEIVIDLPPVTTSQLPEGAKLVLPRRHDIAETDDGRLDLTRTPSLDHPDVMLQLGEESFHGDSLPVRAHAVPRVVPRRLAGAQPLHRPHHLRRRGPGPLASQARDRSAHPDAGAPRLRDGPRPGRSGVHRPGGFQYPRQAARHDGGAGLQRLQHPRAAAVPPAVQRQTQRLLRPDRMLDGPHRISNRVTEVDVARAGVFDFFLRVFRDEDEAVYAADVDRLEGFKSFKKYDEWRTYQLSDHFPMWAEFRTTSMDEHLEHISVLISVER